jgi:hypothetical protein
MVWTNASIRRQPIERVLVAGEENLLLVLEVVVEIPFLHVQRRGDLFDGRAVITEPPERLRGAFQDVDAGRGLGVAVARPPPALRPAGLENSPGGRG